MGSDCAGGNAYVSRECLFSNFLLYKKLPSGVGRKCARFWKEEGNALSMGNALSIPYRLHTTRRRAAAPRHDEARGAEAGRHERQDQSEHVLDDLVPAPRAAR